MMQCGIKDVIVFAVVVHCVIAILRPCLRAVTSTCMAVGSLLAPLTRLPIVSRLCSSAARLLQRVLQVAAQNHMLEMAAGTALLRCIQPFMDGNTYGHNAFVAERASTEGGRGAIRAGHDTSTLQDIAKQQQFYVAEAVTPIVTLWHTRS